MLAASFTRFFGGSSVTPTPGRIEKRHYHVPLTYEEWLKKTDVVEETQQLVEFAEQQPQAVEPEIFKKVMAFRKSESPVISAAYDLELIAKQKALVESLRKARNDLMFDDEALIMIFASL